ncbi:MULTISPECIES: DUF397 domain-containing protein [Streptomyces]|nr:MULTISPECIES: DUF397 domain-containing protein [Streptomyces]MCE3034337.1 DUF397 domain-containing protein [Streptomyces sp. CMSTAAHL-2]TGZ18241.1 hypothetical protein DV517_32140 [Streptomyces sp. S816]WDO08527.1 DUF397 domain-containing protein [Streptomyces murinus]
MSQYFNGMRSDVIQAAGCWQKARVSQGAGACVEMRKLNDGQVAVRNSRFPEGPALIFTVPEVEALLSGVKGGEFDHMAN